MKHIFQQSYRSARWWMLSVSASLALVGSASATDAIFQNYSSLYFTTAFFGGNPPPIYDVTAFDNENIFSVTYLTAPTLYETLNTYYYTNNGTMIADGSVGSGFKFDAQTANVIPRKSAGTFFNPGTIRCNSILDGFLSSGKCVVDATNIINSGTIISGGNGEINLAAKYADLSFGFLALEPTAKFSAVGAVGTGANWDPTLNLTPNFAVSSTPNQVFAFPSSPYMQILGLGTTNVIVRAVFIANNSPNVPYNVYFGGPSNPTLGPGGGTIEWTGIYQDPASCNSFTNYLYLNDFFELVGTTNIAVQNNGVPNNFTFTQSSTPLMNGAVPETTNFQNIFQPAATINPNYAYVNAQFLSTSVATNASGANPNGALTNLPGKILITASNELNLANLQLSGENYLSIVAPNQFDGSQFSQIVAPYVDINLGVTNGNLNLANLIASGVATIGGSLQAWSGQWNFTDAGGTNYNFRVVIVSSQLTPQSPSWVHNLRLHATNSLVISDVMNVYQSLAIDAQRLTLTTNTCGNGFTSFDGELNWYNTVTFGPTQIPNVLWLTNSGAIRALNDSVFGTNTLRYAAFINNGLIVDNGITIWTTNFVNAGSITNGSGSFLLTSQRAVMTNGSVYANFNVSITTSNLIITNEVIRAGRSLTIIAPDLLTDVPTNLPAHSSFSSNNWVVGALGVANDGLSLPVKPALGDLLGTTITTIAPTNKSIVHLWSGQDRGYSVSGFSNNAAIGHLVLDALGAAPLNGRFTFNGASISNAIYVDEIEFKDYSTNREAGNKNMQGITFNTNIVIYYAQAILNGSSIAEKLNLQNTNNLVNNQTSHFRWLPAYTGFFSSTNLVYPDGSTNVVNAALAQSGFIDSNGDGIVNNADPTPFFVSSQINFRLTITNVPPRYARLTWMTIPNATNTVLFKTNLLSPVWSVLTNFISPQPYRSPASPVVLLDPVGTNAAKFYRITVAPWLTYPNSY